MSLTNVTAFKTLINTRIPSDKMKKIWIIPLRQDDKRPDVRKGDSWKLNESYRLSVRDAANRLKSGKNIGLVGLPGGIMFLDIDVEKGKLKASDEILRLLPETFTIKSRNGGYQLYFLNDGFYENQLFKIGDLEIGELRTDWQYVVGVGSYVPASEENYGGDGRYSIFHDAPIAKFEGEITKYFKKRTEKKEEKLETWKGKELKADEITREEHEKKLKEQGKVRTSMSKEEISLFIWAKQNKFVEQKNNGVI